MTVRSSDSVINYSPAKIGGNRLPGQRFTVTDQRFDAGRDVVDGGQFVARTAGRLFSHGQTLVVLHVERQNGLQDGEHLEGALRVGRVSDHGDADRDRIEYGDVLGVHLVAEIQCPQWFLGLHQI